MYSAAMLYREAYYTPTHTARPAVPVAPGADPDREASRRLLMTPTGVLALALVLGGTAMAWQEARQEIGADGYHALASVAARSCRGVADLKERTVRGPIRNAERMGVELHLQELARARAISGAGLAEPGCAA
jgi:hypothetical protein